MVRMISIRGNDNIDFSQFTLFELISAYLTEFEKQPRNWKYLWCKVNDRIQLKAELRKRWSDELVEIDCYFINVEKRSNRFLKMKKDFEEYIERLIRIKKALDRKEKQSQLRSINRRFTLRKTLKLVNCKL